MYISGARLRADLGAKKPISEKWEKGKEGVKITVFVLKIYKLVKFNALAEVKIQT